MVIDAPQIDPALLKTIRACLIECDDDTKQDIVALMKLIESQEATTDEKQQAGITIKNLLFPSGSIDLADKEAFYFTKNARVIDAEFDKEEATFADKLSALMKEKGLTQSQLAERIGVGQSAIANMLARECRPQKRSVEKLAVALSVAPEVLWPNNR